MDWEAEIDSLFEDIFNQLENAINQAQTQTKTQPNILLIISTSQST